MTAADLRDLLVRDLARAHGGGGARWRRAVAGVKAYRRSTHPHCNWEVRAAGAGWEIEIVERAADAMRERLPFIAEP